jgi:hypothetical protein
MFSTKQAHMNCHFCGPPLKSVRQFETSDLEDLLIEAQGAGLDFDLMVEGERGQVAGLLEGKDREIPALLTWVGSSTRVSRITSSLPLKASQAK